jgi:hypothetical protein
MTAGELSSACARALVNQLASQPAPGTRGWREPEEIAADLILGAITRALDEQTRSVSEVVHVHGSPGAIDVKVTKSTQGVSLEVDCKRAREPGESYQQAAAASARLVAESYSAAVEEIAAIGLVPGKHAQ